MTAAQLRTVRVALGLGASELGARLDLSGVDVLRVEERDVTGRHERWSARVHEVLEGELERELRLRFARWQDAARSHAGISAEVARAAFQSVTPTPVVSTSTPDFGASADW